MKIKAKKVSDSIERKKSLEELVEKRVKLPVNKVKTVINE